ncbi:MAG TPA: anti-sigma factor [Novosphingobium sp.]|nr:anti-sigma factor [Novosphingobium sp.]
MSFTDEDIMAYVDGELDEATRERMERAARSDEVLAARIAAQHTLRQQLHAHFNPSLAEPVPDEWMELIRKATSGPMPSVAPPAPNVASIADARERKAASQPARIARPAWWGVGMAAAASLVLGLFVGANWHAGPVVAGNGALLASGDLAQALDTRLASAQEGSGNGIRVLSTFRRAGADGAGADVCRVFAGPSASGIACHAQDGWRMQHLLPGEGGNSPSGDYRQAGSAEAALMALAQDMAAGAPMDATQERAAQAQGWK